MNRRYFLQKTGVACMSICALPLLSQSCSNVRYVTGVLSGNKLVIGKADFVTTQKNKIVRKDFVLVKHSQLDFPISIYEVGTDQYHALYMQCSHQGCEVNAYTTQLVCPCHGSEFDTTGKVLQGPAEKDLHQFAVTTDSTNIFIQIA